MFDHYLKHITKLVLSGLIVSSFILVAETSAHAWGKKGHQIVAAIAEKYLQAHSPTALARAKQLLGNQSLVDVATFADDVRTKRQYTKNWHFVDIALDDDSYRPE